MPITIHLPVESDSPSAHLNNVGVAAVYMELPRVSLNMHREHTEGEFYLRATSHNNDESDSEIELRDGGSEYFGQLEFNESVVIEVVSAADGTTIGRTVVGIDELVESQQCTASNFVVRSVTDSRFRKVGTVSFRFVVYTQLPSGMQRTLQPRDDACTDAAASPTIRNRSVSGTVVDDITIIGHRGIGSNELGSRIRENTILAFLQAANYGADAVEFDVFLTSDKKAMIYHDLEINHSAGHVKIPITSLCVDGLQSLDYNNQSQVQASSQSKVKKAKPSSGTDMGKKVKSMHNLSGFNLEPRPSLQNYLEEASPRQHAMDHHSPGVQESLPSLMNMLLETPDSLGALVEIKYPTVAAIRQFPSRSCHCRDTVADVILRDVATFGNPQTRRFAFSSFDPEMCIALRRKQGRFRVILNAWYGYEDTHDNTEVDFSDIRNRDPKASVAFCLANGINGLCVEYDWLSRHLEFAAYCRERGLVIYTYGPENNRAVGVEMQIHHMGVAGCIVDNLGRFQADQDGELLTLADARKFWSTMSPSLYSSTTASLADEDAESAIELC